MSYYDWIVVNGDNGRAECRRCGEWHALRFPIPLDEIGTIGDAFTVLHKDCLPKEETPDAPV